MECIRRDLSQALEDTFDLIVIGGGIYGITLAHEASSAGLKAILLEKDDFGQHTSFNSLRIVHGGLRYLQSLDIHRYRESVAERSWFLQYFPDLVRPIPCLMPLYGEGLKKPYVFRAALLLNHLLSCNRNRGILPERHIPYGRVLNPEETRNLFPAVDQDGLKGAVVWYDALMEDSQCLVIAILRRACALGAIAFNYMDVIGLRVQNGEVAGVTAVDRESGQTYHVRGRRVVNAGGPWSRDLAKRFHRDIPALFTPSLAWNVLFNNESISDHAIAVGPKRTEGQTFFLVPWKGAVLAGTGHAPCSVYDGKPASVTAEQLDDFIGRLNEALPGLGFDKQKVLHVFSGYLPVTASGSTELTRREVIVDHAKAGGPRGLFSISGIKFTTARRVAEKTIRAMFPKLRRNPDNSTTDMSPGNDWKRILFKDIQSKEKACMGAEFCNTLIQKLIDEESVRHLDDLVIRRMPLKKNPAHVMQLAKEICSCLKWNELECEQENIRLKSHFRHYYIAGTHRPP